MSDVTRRKFFTTYVLHVVRIRFTHAAIREAFHSITVLRKEQGMLRNDTSIVIRVQCNYSRKYRTIIIKPQYLTCTEIGLRSKI